MISVDSPLPDLDSLGDEPTSPLTVRIGVTSICAVGIWCVTPGPLSCALVAVAIGGVLVALLLGLVAFGCAAVGAVVGWILTGRRIGDAP